MDADALIAELDALAVELAESTPAFFFAPVMLQHLDDIFRQLADGRWRRDDPLWALLLDEAQSALNRARVVCAGGDPETCWTALKSAALKVGLAAEALHHVPR